MDSDILELQRTLYTSKNPTRRWLHTQRRDLIVDALRRCASQGPRERALEVGFGSGVYLPTLSVLFDEVIASDMEEIYLKAAADLNRTYPNLRIIHDDITHTKLSAERFDLILCTEVIEHIADSKKALANLHDLLKPGGTLVLSTPQPWSFLELTAKIAFMPGIIDLVRLIYREPVLETGHINLMTGKEVTTQLNAAGFRIRERFISGMYLPIIAEASGRSGLRLEQWLEPKLLHGPLSWMIWTQYYIAEAA